MTLSYRSENRGSIYPTGRAVITLMILLLREALLWALTDLSIVSVTEQGNSRNEDCQCTGDTCDLDNGFVADTLADGFRVFLSSLINAIGTTGEDNLRGKLFCHDGDRSRISQYYCGESRVFDTHQYSQQVRITD